MLPEQNARLELQTALQECQAHVKSVEVEASSADLNVRHFKIFVTPFDGPKTTVEFDFGHGWTIQMSKDERCATVLPKGTYFESLNQLLLNLSPAYMKSFHQQLASSLLVESGTPGHTDPK